MTMQNCPLKIGDIVLVDLDSSHRNLWPMGKIVELFLGSDGQVRSCRIEVKGALYERTLNKVVPLEISCSEQCSVSDVTKDKFLPRRNPSRKAALNASAERKRLIEENAL